jgi:hypothetical protein
LKLRERVAAKLAEMKESPDESGGEDDAEGEDATPAVFLAEGTQDLDDDRDALATIVEKLGYRVLPAKLYPRGAKEFRARLERDLAKSTLFVQLLGQFGTRRTEEFPEGYEGLQLECAKAANVPMLRAYQRDTVDFDRIKKEERREFLRSRDVMALDLEEFKMAIYEKLKELALREAKPETPDLGGAPVLIHVLGDDLESAFRIRDRLAALNMAYEIVDEEEPLEELAKIRDYAGMVLVYGERSSGKWIKHRMRTLMDVRLSKQPNEPACVLYFDPPEKRNQLLASPPPFFHTVDSGSGDAEFQKFVSELEGRKP